nr:P-loop containing nucleoside triphosphate hydrolases superfamily protein [Tanacetum cinerariifolium]
MTILEKNHNTKIENGEDASNSKKKRKRNKNKNKTREEKYVVADSIGGGEKEKDDPKEIEVREEEHVVADFISDSEKEEDDPKEIEVNKQQKSFNLEKTRKTRKPERKNYTYQRHLKLHIILDISERFDLI